MNNIAVLKLKRYISKVFQKSRNLLTSKLSNQNRSVSQQSQKIDLTPHQQEIINEVFSDLEKFAEHIGLKKNVSRKLHNIKKEFILEFEFIINNNSKRNIIESYTTYKIINNIRKTIEHRVDRMDFTDKTVNTSFIYALGFVSLLRSWYNLEVLLARNSVPGARKSLENSQLIGLMNFQTITFLIVTIYFVEKFINFISAFRYQSTIVGLKRCLLFLDKKYLE